MLVQAHTQIPGVGMPRRVPRGHGHVHGRQCVLIQAKRLARQAFDAVSQHRGAEGAGGDGQAQSRALALIRQHRETEIGVG